MFHILILRSNCLLLIFKNHKTKMETDLFISLEIISEILFETNNYLYDDLTVCY